MNPIVLQLANGNLFFVGLVMIVAALFLRLWFEGRILGLVLRIGYSAGILLGQTDSKNFYIQLDQLLGKLAAENSQIVVFELPLFPFCNAFGKHILLAFN
jgi:hypothetical protein